MEAPQHQRSNDPDRRQARAPAARSAVPGTAAPVAAPSLTTPASLLVLQQLAGNEAVRRLIRPTVHPQRLPTVQRLPATHVGPLSGRSVLGGPRRMTVTMEAGDTLRSIADEYLGLWNDATPFTPPGGQPVQFNRLTADQVARGLAVYNRGLLGLPNMGGWQVGLHLRLPVEIDDQDRHTVHPDVMAAISGEFSDDWRAILDQAPAALAAPDPAALQESATAFLNEHTTATARGIVLLSQALTNSQQAAPLATAVLDRLGNDAFDVALEFMDEMVIHQLAVLMGDEHGRQIVARVQQALQAAPANPTAEQQASLTRANTMLQGSEVLAQVVAGAEGTAERRRAVLALAEWCRANLPDRALLDAYLDNPDVDQAEKVATIGRLATEVARMEFQLGWMYEGGVADPDGRGWENAGSNRGEFIDTYTDEIQTTGAAPMWCTTFAGYAFSRVGFEFNEDVAANTARSMFWSGYRLRLWATTGEANDETQITEAAETVINAASSGELIDRADWRAHRRALSAAADDAARDQQVIAFLAGQITPQPGDILIIGGQNNTFAGHSHTVMVERYDPGTQTISTVEGNKNPEQAVFGRHIDISDPDTVRGIIAMVRLGTEYFDDGAAAAPAAGGQATTSADVLRGMTDMNTRLTALAGNQQWINSTNPQATVYQWINGEQAQQQGP